MSTMIYELPDGNVWAVSSDKHPSSLRSLRLYSDAIRVHHVGDNGDLTVIRGKKASEEELLRLLLIANYE